MSFLITLLFFIPFIVIGVLYVLSISRLLMLILPENRVISPALAWLLLIPLFNFIWHFVLVFTVTGSVKKEFTAKNINENVNNAKAVGIVASVAWITMFLINTFIGELYTLRILLTLIISVISLVFFIAFWMKISGYTKMLKAYNIAKQYS